MPLLIAAAIIEAAIVCLVVIAGSVVESILLLLFAQVAYLFAVYHVFKDAGPRRFIIPIAVVFRLTVICLPAPFTDDLYRYRWEALAQDSRINPYQARPSDPQYRNLRDSTYNRIPAADFKAGYGPAWETLSHWTFRFARLWTTDPYTQALWFKLPSALFDLATIGALIWLLRLRGLPDARVLIYAWSSLPIWEFWANAHNDSVMVFLVIASLALAAQQRFLSGSAVFGAAIAIKWWPVLLVPSFARRCRDLRPFLIAGATLACFALPFIANITENAQFMSGFVGGWRNNDSLFGLLLYLTGDLYRAKYLAFAIIVAAVLWLSLRDWPLERIALWVVVVLLLVSANCHPWYLTWLLPFLAFYPHPSLLLWVSLAPLAYTVLIGWKILGEWNGSTPERWWIYVPVFAALSWEALRAAKAANRRRTTEHCLQ